MTKGKHPIPSLFLLRTICGWMLGRATEKGLCRLNPPLAEKPSFHFPHPSIERFPSLEDALNRYLKGEKVDFSSFPLDLTSLPPFQRAVLEEVRKLRWGELATYEDIAERLGDRKKRRAVGQALARNPLPILIPCHRVIKKDHTIGGYSWGIGFKAFLLHLEGHSLLPSASPSETRVGNIISCPGNWDML